MKAQLTTILIIALIASTYAVSHSSQTFLDKNGRQGGRGGGFKGTKDEQEDFCTKACEDIDMDKCKANCAGCMDEEGGDCPEQCAECLPCHRCMAGDDAGKECACMEACMDTDMKWCDGNCGGCMDEEEGDCHDDCKKKCGKCVGCLMENFGDDMDDDEGKLLVSKKKKGKKGGDEPKKGGDKDCDEVCEDMGWCKDDCAGCMEDDGDCPDKCADCLPCHCCMAGDDAGKECEMDDDEDEEEEDKPKKKKKGPKGGDDDDDEEEEVGKGQGKLLAAKKKGDKKGDKEEFDEEDFDEEEWEEGMPKKKKGKKGGDDEDEDEEDMEEEDKTLVAMRHHDWQDERNQEELEDMRRKMSEHGHLEGEHDNPEHDNPEHEEGKILVAKEMGDKKDMGKDMGGKKDMMGDKDMDGLKDMMGDKDMGGKDMGGKKGMMGDKKENMKKKEMKQKVNDALKKKNQMSYEKEKMEKKDMKQKEGNCDEICLDGWCEEKCKEGCKDCDMESCPESCSEECQDKCHNCAKCHMMQHDPKELEHKVREGSCAEKCMDGWCEKECGGVCDDCDVDKEGKVSCPKESKCPKQCKDNCGECAACHMAVDRQMQKQQQDPKELEHKVKEGPCGDKCMDGWCEFNCGEECEVCEVDKEGKVSCPKESKCPEKCQEKCGDCAACHMAVDREMEKHQKQLDVPCMEKSKEGKCYDCMVCMGCDENGDCDKVCPDWCMKECEEFGMCMMKHERKVQEKAMDEAMEEQMKKMEEEMEKQMEGMNEEEKKQLIDDMKKSFKKHMEEEKKKLGIK